MGTGGKETETETTPFEGRVPDPPRLTERTGEGQRADNIEVPLPLPTRVSTSSRSQIQRGTVR